MEILEILLSASFWAAVVRIASPLIFATMGELICERAGVLNLGIEGIMVVGAFAGWMVKYFNLNLSPSFGKPPTIQNIFLFFFKEYLHASKLVALESLIIEILLFL